MIQIHSFKEEEKERSEGRPQLGGLWKVSNFWWPLKGSNAWWPLKSFNVWWSLKGSNVWWPLEGEGEASFSPFFISPLTNFI